MPAGAVRSSWGHAEGAGVICCGKQHTLVGPGSLELARGWPPSAWWASLTVSVWAHGPVSQVFP